LNGSGSYDDEGIVSYLWDFGDNSSPEEGQEVSHTYNTTGDFTVYLTVTDISGSIDVDSTVVSIGPGTNFVDITKAEYNATKEQLKVEAVSSKGGCARLEVANYGSMTYDAKRDIYKLSRRAENNPGLVTVVCGPYLSESETVTEKGAGGGKK
jgi:PKD repeat protein